ncbi:recombinase family protein [Blautia wexlerae]|uniref:recombinase family protein n=1 Tax=Blautia wexlerae TaxID=418240 RepID=UPI00156F91BB|nr:recombinase family protein [Blautia wexlerae]NSG63450.1 recombinase family protein [Blautia wexlerae]
MARKSRRANVVQEKKEELQVFASIITQKQLATAAYARLSVEKENDESIQTQIELLHQYIQDHEEYKLVDTYVDDGYTGTDFDRPEFIRLMQQLKVGINMEGESEKEQEEVMNDGMDMDEEMMMAGLSMFENDF